MKKYFPILLSKPGELTALSKLTPAVIDDVSPILQIIDGTIDKIKTFSEDWGSGGGNQIFLDVSLIKSLNPTAISQLTSHINTQGVEIIPIVQENSDQRYIRLIIRLLNSGKVNKICIRFSNSSGGFMNIDSAISSLTASLGMNANKVSILLDFGLITQSNYGIITSLSLNVINSISGRSNYENVIVAAGSFPENLGSLNPAGRVYRLNRYEWGLWTSLQSNKGVKGTVKYSDYGTKYPYYSEANFQGSCSIKYTQEDDFVIYRGQISSNHPDGNGQYLTFSGQLIASSDYSGATFSWGDARIDFYAQQNISDPKRKTGNAGSWVEISQNHHITLLTSLL